MIIFLHHNCKTAKLEKTCAIIQLFFFLANFILEQYIRIGYFLERERLQFIFIVYL